MRSLQISVKFDQVTYEEILFQAAENKQTLSEAVRQLVVAGLITRLEKKSDSQFAIVDKHISRLEERLVTWLIQASKAIAKSYYYVEQLALFETTDDERTALREEAEKQARYFLESRLPRPGEYGELE